MTFDNDIRWMRRCIVVLMLLNAFAAAMNLWHRQWLVSGACALWIVNLLLWLKSMNAQQKTRDAIRVALAMMVEDPHH